MAAVKLQGFRGTAPKVSPELLPSLGAQIARNVKLYSGDLIPFPQPFTYGNHGRTGTVRTLYGLRDNNDNPVFMTWASLVDVATPSFSSEDDQRFYYTGDGVPKVSNYELATAVGAPYPDNYYELGLPLPTAVLAAAATAFTTKSVSSFSRSTAGEATISTSTAHGLRTGALVAVSGFTYRAGTYSQVASSTVTVTLVNHGLETGAVVSLDFISGNGIDGEYQVTKVNADTFTVVSPVSTTTSGNVNLNISAFNTTGSEVTVIDSTSFSYFNPGHALSTTSALAGNVDLASTTLQRTYLYTWYTPWGEESIGSEPSAAILVKEGQTVTITGLPTTNPVSPESGSQSTNFIRGLRLYRTFVGDSGSQYFRLQTLWFPTATATVARSSNVATVKLAYPHNFIEGDRFKLSGCANVSFDVTGGIVVDVIDSKTFTYASVGADLPTTADTSGTLYHDAAFKKTDAARYWGDGGYSFIDDFNPALLTETLTTTEYSPPPSTLKGLRVMNNDTLVGFVGNRIYFSEPGHPHAWPEEYEITIEHDIVAVEPVSGVGVLVMTEAYPYLLQGTDPSGLTPTRIDALYPCVSARGVVPMSYGVVYPTHEGLAVVSPTGSGTSIATEALHTDETWSAALDPSSIVAVSYGDQYFASHSTGSILYQRDENGGYMVDCDEQFTAIWHYTLTNRFFYVKDATGDVYEWDNNSQPLQTMEWKSKVMTLEEYTNLGAARVVADYGQTSLSWDQASTTWGSTSMLWNAFQPLTFKLWVDKNLVYTGTIANKNIFRLPSGYRSDTYEIGISGNMRVRSVHLGETPLSLKSV